jgi:CDP-glucose 4,6-dehydratase
MKGNLSKDHLEFFGKKKILITGHTGFIGSWLTKWLSMLGSQVLGYSLDPSTHPNMFSNLNFGSNLIDVRNDILNKESLKKAVSDFEPEIVFHLAAQPIVLESYNNPEYTYQTNVIGTVNLLDILRKNQSVKVIVVITSDKVYENVEWIYPYRETDPLGGKDPYSASKSCQDIVVSSFRESFFAGRDVSVSSIRAGNVIGGGDWGEFRLVPDIVRGITQKKIIDLRNPYSTRPWQHVLDLAFGMMKLAEMSWLNTEYAGIWNFGPTGADNLTVKELAGRLINFWGAGEYKISKSGKFYEASYLKLDISKARHMLNWYPLVDIDRSVVKTVEWYKKYYHGRNEINKFTEKQINEYSENRNAK